MPDLSRRSFFRSMVAAGVVATIDPEELLWVPGKNKVFIPPAPKPMNSCTVCNVAFAVINNVWVPGGEVTAQAREIAAMIAQLQTVPGPHPVVISTWGGWSHS